MSTKIRPHRTSYSTEEIEDAAEATIAFLEQPHPLAGEVSTPPIDEPGSLLWLLCLPQDRKAPGQLQRGGLHGPLYRAISKPWLATETGNPGLTLHGFDVLTGNRVSQQDIGIVDATPLAPRPDPELTGQYVEGGELTEAHLGLQLYTRAGIIVAETLEEVPGGAEVKDALTRNIIFIPAGEDVFTGRRVAPAAAIGAVFALATGAPSPLEVLEVARRAVIEGANSMPHY